MAPTNHRRSGLRLRRHARPWCVLGTVLAASLLIASAASAGGEPDPSFGADGWEELDIGSETYDMLVQPDGRIVIAGDVYGAFLARLMPDGSLDSSFAGQGHLTVESDWRPSVARQPDGKLLLATRAPGSGVVVHRFMVDGAPDPTFGEDGIFATGPGAPGTPNGIGVQSDGSIVVGMRWSTFPEGIGLLRLTTDGQRDPSFGVDGIVEIVESDYRLTLGFALEADDDILVSGYTHPYVGFVVRLDPDGVLDPSFGGDGEIVTTVPSSSEFQAVLPLPDGRVLAGGRVYGFPDDTWLLARYNADGTPDASFGTSGIVQMNPSPGGDVALDLSLAGSWVYATGVIDDASRDLAIARFTDAGVLDPTFGTAGLAWVSMPGRLGRAWATAVQPDSTVVVAGHSLNTSLGSNRVALARYVGDLLITPALVNFGSIGRGVADTPVVVTVKNHGTASATVTGVTITGTNAADFSIGSQTCTAAPIPVAGSCTVSVGFTPSAIGTRGASLSITGPSPVGTRTRALSGTGLDPIVVVPAALPFGNVVVGIADTAEVVTVSNIGAVPATVSGVTITGTNAADFSIGSQTCTAAPIPVAGSCTVSVGFTPSAIGTRGASLSITGPSPVGTRTRALSGTGLDPIVVVPAALPFGNVVVGIADTAEVVTVSNIGAVPATVSGVTITGTNAADFSIGSQTCTAAPIPVAGSCTVSVGFTPSAIGTRGASLSITGPSPVGTRTRALSGTGLQPPRIVSAGWSHSCALAKPDRSISCWGLADSGSTTVPVGAYKTVSAGNDFTCAIRTNDTLACWGFDEDGQASPPSGTFTSVSAGGWHGCAVRTTGALACWGFDEDGQASPPSGTFTSVSSSAWHSCAVRTNGTVACWGNNDYGQASPHSGTFTAVAAGVQHGCGLLASGAITCWGWNADGQRNAPTGTFLALSSGNWHNCGLRTNGQLACWGWNAYGQTGAPSGTFSGVGAGGWHSCTIKEDGTPTCWGDNYYNQATTSQPTPTTYVPVASTRLLDSRVGNGLTGKFKANIARSFQIAGRGPVPANAVAVTGNLTVAGQTGAGYASLTPVATKDPTTSTLNFPRGDNRANNVTVALGAGGKLAAVYKAADGKTTDIILDVTGYFVADESGATYDPVAPVRLLDTRVSNGLGGPFVPSVARTWSIAGRGGIPTDAIAISGNLTVVGQTGAGYVSIAATPTPNPSTSTLNFPVSDTRANGFTVKLGANGTLSATYKGAAGTRTHLILDVTGYYLHDLSGERFYPLTPDRLLDTRVETGLTGKFGASSARTLTVAARVGVPSDASALSGNLTVVGQSKAGYVSLTKSTTNSPTTSTINFPAGDVRANGVTGALSGSGTIGLVYKSQAGASTHLILDITGYFGPAPDTAGGAVSAPPATSRDPASGAIDKVPGGPLQRHRSPSP